MGASVGYLICVAGVVVAVCAAVGLTPGKAGPECCAPGLPSFMPWLCHAVVALLLLLLHGPCTGHVQANSRVCF